MNDLTLSPARIHGIDALRLEGGGLWATVTTAMGPRILGFGTAGGPNLLVELPDLRISLPGLPDYRMLGGHRLWHTPEVPEVTYRPDDAPVSVTEVPGGVDLVGADDPVQGIRKRLRVTLEGGIARVEHELRNIGAGALATSAWAITQVPPEGEAWLPLGASAPGSAYLPDRSVVLWPYASLADERLQLGDDVAVVRGVAGSEGRVKVGTARGHGWIAWRRGRTLLVIGSAFEGGSYADMGASVQCYACGDFVELETLGPVEPLAPGQATVHRQTWRIVEVDADAPAATVVRDVGLPVR
jgi:hypothetical protein